MAELRLLIVEDSPLDAELAVAQLEEAGYMCRWERVQRRAELAHCLAAGAWDLVILDYHLPDFDGLSALALVRDHDDSIPVIVLSGTIGEEAAVDSLKAGAADCVLKGNLARLAPVARRALRERDEHRRRQQAEDRLRLMLEQIPAVLWTTDTDLRFTSITGAGLARLNLDPSSLIGRALPGCLAKGDSDPSTIQAYERALTGESVNFEHDWNGRTLHCHVEPLRDRAGTPIGLVGVGQDISDLRRNAEQLRQYAQRLANLRSIDHAILAQESVENVARATLARIRDLVPCDLARVVLFDFESHTAHRLATDAIPHQALNVTALSLDEFSAPEVFVQHPSRYVEDIVALPTRPPILDRLLRAGMHSLITESLLVRGELLGSFNLSAKRRAAFNSEHRDISREVAAQLAITIQQARLREQLQQHAAELERRVAERTAQLQAANQELEAFSYSVSHDLRAPLRAIDGFARMLEEDGAGQLDDTARHHLKRVQASTQRMGQLIDDLLDLSRLSRHELHHRVVDLSAVAQAIAAELRQSQPQRQVTFVIAEGVTAHGDPTLLRAMLDNLLGNAWKYTSKHTAARIEFGTMSVAEFRARAGTAASLEILRHLGANVEQIYFVRDDGAGFDPAYAAKLFAPFQRLHAASEFDGTGIGLATVQRIIRRHGGRVWAESVVEQGATFHFTLS